MMEYPEEDLNDDDEYPSCLQLYCNYEQTDIEDFIDIPYGIYKAHEQHRISEKEMLELSFLLSAAQEFKQDMPVPLRLVKAYGISAYNMSVN
jgi:hypothetical protein